MNSHRHGEGISAWQMVGTEGRKEEAAGWFSTVQGRDQQSEGKRAKTVGSWKWVSKGSDDDEKRRLSNYRRAGEDESGRAGVNASS